MSDKLWKSVERRIAKYLGGERVPVTGRQRGSAPDIKHNWLSIEVKQRDKLPEWIHEAMDQAEKSAIWDVPSVEGTTMVSSLASALQRKQLPVSILHQTGNRIEDAYVVMRLKDFREWFV